MKLFSFLHLSSLRCRASDRRPTIRFVFQISGRLNFAFRNEIDRKRRAPSFFLGSDRFSSLRGLAYSVRLYSFDMGHVRFASDINQVSKIVPLTQIQPRIRARWFLSLVPSCEDRFVEYRRSPRSSPALSFFRYERGRRLCIFANQSKPEILIFGNRKEPRDRLHVISAIKPGDHICLLPNALSRERLEHSASFGNFYTFGAYKILTN